MKHLVVAVALCLFLAAMSGCKRANPLTIAPPGTAFCQSNIEGVTAELVLTEPWVAGKSVQAQYVVHLPSRPVGQPFIVIRHRGANTYIDNWAWAVCLQEDHALVVKELWWLEEEPSIRSSGCTVSPKMIGPRFIYP